jgi:hypothetical protein
VNAVIGWVGLCALLDALETKRAFCPSPELNQNSLVSSIHISFNLILLWLSNGVFNSHTLYVQMVFEADAP